MKLFYPATALANTIDRIASILRALFSPQLHNRSGTFWSISSMVRTPVRQITLAEFLELPETKPASEYLDGQILQKPMPQGQHSIIQRQLLFAIDPMLHDRGIAQAFPELRCNFGNRSIVPDVAVFESSRIPTNDRGEIENGFEIAPDWIIEILSPGQSTTKVLKRHSIGQPLSWS